MKELRLKKWVKVVIVIAVGIVFEIICYKAMVNTEKEIQQCMEDGTSRYICEQRLK